MKFSGLKATAPPWLLLECFGGTGKQQISPLRYAPVEMTVWWWWKSRVKRINLQGLQKEKLKAVNNEQSKETVRIGESRIGCPDRVW